VIGADRMIGRMIGADQMFWPTGAPAR
jgi:hypothetical protein